jgi:starvation-inducible DNA-binding protein
MNPQHRTPSAPSSYVLASPVRQAIGDRLRLLLADVLALYIKTRSCHWHVCGAHFREYHLLFDEQANELLAITDEIAERARKLGQTAITSIEQITLLKSIDGLDRVDIDASDMLKRLVDDNSSLCASMRKTHAQASEGGDVATTSLLENWIDECENRIWFLTSTLGDPDS